MTPTTLRIGLLGVSHWHCELYLEPLRKLNGVEIVGVSDPRPRVAQDMAEDLGCYWSEDFRDVCDRAKPDFVFALGRHCDMAEEGKFLLEKDIPFVMEKPCGLNAIEVAALDELAAKRGAFAAVPFVWRQSELRQVLAATTSDERLSYLSFRLIAGPPSRYPAAGCEWMLDPAQSGGGCTINLAGHFIDLFHALVGTSGAIEVVSAVMANEAFGLPIEDYSVLILSLPGSRCLIETGYLYPAPSSLFDMRFSIRAETHYLIATDDHTVEVSDLRGGSETVNALTTNVPHYPVFVDDVLQRFRTDQKPLANLHDMVAVMEVVDRAYELGASGMAKDVGEHSPR